MCDLYLISLSFFIAEKSFFVFRVYRAISLKLISVMARTRGFTNTKKTTIIKKTSKVQYLGSIIYTIRKH